MSNIALYANNDVSSLAGAITNTSLTANLASGGGALFPHPGAGQYFTLTFNDSATGLLDEIVWVTNVTGDTITMIRAQEGTLAQNWSAGDIASQLLTAGGLQQFVQFPQLQSLSTNKAVDTGSANAYSVALVPALTAHSVGSPIFWQATNPNTGASTFNDGAGVLPLVNPDGTALGSGTIVANGYYISIADGAGHFQLVSASNEALSSQGIATVGDMKFRPTSESIPGWVVANGLTIGNATSGASGLASATAFALFNWHWTNFSNTQCPVVPSGRGSSAAADFAANKTIQVLAWQGMGPIGVDTMGGAATTFLSGVTVQSGSTTVPGSIYGTNSTNVSLAQLPVHTPTGGVSTSVTSSLTTVPSIVFSAGGANTPSPGANQTISGAIAATFGGSSTFTGNAIGSGSTLSIASRSMGVFWYLKL